MKTAAFAALAFPALMLAACSSEPEPAPVENVDEAIEAPVLDTPEPTPMPLPEPTPTETPEPTPTPEPLADDAQMELDAAATGMTARVDRSAPLEEDEVPAPVAE